MEKYTINDVFVKKYKCKNLKEKFSIHFCLSMILTIEDYAMIEDYFSVVVGNSCRRIPHVNY